MSGSSSLAGALPLAARRALLAALNAGHHRAFLASIAESCTRAASGMDFERVEEKTGPLGERRVIATDSEGRSLVTEIRSDRARNVTVETEVIGGCGSCEALLDRFDKALAGEGVRSQPPRRRPTGGVAETAAAREFLAKPVERARRLQRLNEVMKARVRQ